MNRHPEIEELQDYREELLSPERHGEIRAHLRECSACREELAAIGELLDDLAALPLEAGPSRDLWPQIHWRIGARSAREEARPRRAAVTLPVWQLLAAGVVLALISGGAVWTYLAGTVQGPGAVVMEPAPRAVPAVAAEYAAYEGFTNAVAELETVVEEGRDLLGPETIQVLEENLAIIDRAILESRLALAQDPGSSTLRRLLSQTMRRKVDLLQQAAEVIIKNS